MTPPLQGKTVALAEGRQLEELARMLEQEGARTLRCPLVSILDAPDPAPVLDWIAAAITGRIELLVLMTGEALRRLLGFAERDGQRGNFITALAKMRILVRGPKPILALKEVGLAPWKIAQAPTTEGVIATLRDVSLNGVSVGVTRYGNVNEALEQFLAEAGATVYPVMPYVYAPAADDQRVAQLIAEMAAGAVDVLVLTSSPQIERLYEIAQRHNLEEALQQAWQRTRVAAVGPVVAEGLRHHQAPVHICPEQGFVMKNLVQHIKRAFTSS
jgi:uroporphyrinogen-III synthase